MQAVILTQPTPAEQITISECSIPEAKPGWVLLKIKAFGLNHSEQLLRLSEIQADYINKPIIPGIECVGEVIDPSESHFQTGQKVIALMGGMGRSFHGSYAEYALLPQHHIFAVNSDLTWAELAAVPETYFTAWGSLFECLQLKPTDTLMVRGATCALGYAAIQLAQALGCQVIATTHRQNKLPLIAHADKTIIDNGKLAEQISEVNKILELVGAKTLYDSLHCVSKGGIVCHTGILGGAYALNNFDPIKAIPNGVYLTGFFSNNPTPSVIADIFSFLEQYKLKPKIGKIFTFQNIKEACLAQDNGTINGKIVVQV